MWGWDVGGVWGGTHRCGAGMWGEIWGRPTDVELGSVERCGAQMWRGTHRCGADPQMWGGDLWRNVGPIDLGWDP